MGAGVGIRFTPNLVSYILKNLRKKEIFFRKKFILNHHIILNNPSLNRYFSSLILSLYTFFQEFLFDIRFNLNDNSIFSNFICNEKIKISIGIFVTSFGRL